MPNRRILALGGCGEMGRYALKTLITIASANTIIKDIIIADIHLENAQKFANDLSIKASAISVDISNVEQLKKAMQGVDIVINTVGPYYRFGVNVLQSAIESGCDYVDINDDWEPTLQMLDLHQSAKTAGITAIVGAGASPGISNMLAKTAIAELDKCTSVYTGWSLDNAKPEKIAAKASAATVHGIHQLSGTVKEHYNGKLRDSKPIQKVELDYPGIGKRKTYTMGHPESVTLPRYFSELKSSQNLMSTSSVNIFALKFLTWLVDTNLLAVDTVAHIAELLEGPADAENTAEKLLDTMLTAKENKIPLPPIYAVAQGLYQNQPASVATTLSSGPAGGMAGATGVPLAVVASLLLQNKITSKGVFAPEGAIDTNDFFTTLAPLCTPVVSPEKLVITTKSWQANDFQSLFR